MFIKHREVGPEVMVEVRLEVEVEDRVEVRMVRNERRRFMLRDNTSHRPFNRITTYVLPILNTVSSLIVGIFMWLSCFMNSPASGFFALDLRQVRIPIYCISHDSGDFIKGVNGANTRAKGRVKRRPAFPLRLGVCIGMERR